VKKSVKNVHYFTHFFFTEKVSEKLESFSALFGAAIALTNDHSARARSFSSPARNATHTFTTLHGMPLITIALFIRSRCPLGPLYL
jgi:hypothetical protein